tara:strand:- start:986 stop:1648 length:663 start_codon:yes stop_codon:yes gene_type:complete
MAGLTVTTAATTEALTETQIRDYLRVDQDSELGVLTLLRRAAREHCENYTGRTLLDQTLKLSIDGINDAYDPLFEGFRVGPYINFYKEYIALPTAPVRSVSHIKTFNDSDTETTYASTRYFVDTAREPARVVLRTGETWPTALRVANAIEITFVAGYATPADIPHALKMGMLQHIAYMYDQRGDMKDYQQTLAIPPMIAKLYQPYKLIAGLGTSSFSSLG